ncbi:MAG: TIGR04255 family protein [Methanomicrobiales archaeon]
MTQYRNPPIIEAICEFRFSPETKWDPTIPGLVYEKLKSGFPLRESRIEQEIEMRVDDKGLKHHIKPSQRAVILSENRKSLVQIGERILAINHLKPYPGWDNFRPKIHWAFEALKEATDIVGIDRIALVYIDKIEIPGKTVTMEEYFEFLPHLGSKLPQNYSSFIVGCEFPFNDKRDICKLQLTSAIPDNPKYSAFILTTEYFVPHKKAISPENALNWVEDAHTIVRDQFKGCITPKLEELFVTVT